jgi:hypothetical protein
MTALAVGYPRPIDVPTDQPFNAAMSRKTENLAERFAVASFRLEEVQMRGAGQ